MIDITSSASTQTYYSSLAYMLQTFRKEAGLTLHQLAEKSGVSYASCQRWEQGKYGTVETLIKISDALGIGMPDIGFKPKVKK